MNEIKKKSGALLAPPSLHFNRRPKTHLDLFPVCSHLYASPIEIISNCSWLSFRFAFWVLYVLPPPHPHWKWRSRVLCVSHGLAVRARGDYLWAPDDAFDNNHRVDVGRARAMHPPPPGNSPLSRTIPQCNFGSVAYTEVFSA